jgi:nitroreductase
MSLLKKGQSQEEDSYMKISHAIRMKRAIRQFSSRKLPEDEVRIILNAGRRAQSSKNSQPWHFLAIQDSDTLEELSQLGTYAGHLAGASLCVAILTPDPAQRWSIMFDAGQAAAYMQLAAWEMGIGSCIATIYEPDKARELLSFPVDLHLRAALSFGYPQEPELLDVLPQTGGRKTFKELVHYERWEVYE